MATKEDKKRYNLYLNKKNADLVRDFAVANNSNISDVINLYFSTAAQNIKGNDMAYPLKRSQFNNVLRLDDEDMFLAKIKPDYVKRLDALAEKADLTRTKLLNNIIGIVLEELEACRKVGVFQFGLLIRDMKDSLVNWSKKIKGKKVDPL